MASVEWTDSTIEAAGIKLHLSRAGKGREMSKKDAVKTVVREPLIVVLPETSKLLINNVQFTRFLFSKNRFHLFGAGLQLVQQPGPIRL